MFKYAEMVIVIYMNYYQMFCIKYCERENFLWVCIFIIALLILNRFADFYIRDSETLFIDQNTKIIYSHVVIFALADWSAKKGWK